MPRGMGSVNRHVSGPRLQGDCADRARGRLPARAREVELRGVARRIVPDLLRGRSVTHQLQGWDFAATRISCLTASSTCSREADLGRARGAPSSMRKSSRPDGSMLLMSSTFT
jgi:hypothetical protein